MASPFKVFRKHQKFMLALLGVLVMVGFVILPAIMQGMGQRRRANARVATTKNYGDLHSLDGLRWRRQVAMRFFEALGRALVVAHASPAPVQMAVREMVPNQAVSPTSGEALVETWLLARRAEELGLVVDNATISAFIRGLMQDRITPDGLAAILHRANISDNELLSALRQELLAMRLRGIFLLSVRGTTPAERWDYFQRLNRKVTIESLPVPVSRFLNKVADPDEATLRDFFDAYKAEPYDPASPEPGFRVPKKVAFEYLEAEYDTFFNEQVAAVSPEEVKAYYEEHKGDYRKEELPVDEEPAASAEEPAEAGPANAKPADAEPASEAAPGSTGDADETSSTPGTLPFRLASFVTQDIPQEETAEKEEPPAEPAEQPEAASEAPAGGEREPKAEPGPTAPEEGDVAADEPKYLPLEEVEEEIRKIVARDRAKTSIEKLLNDLRAKLEKYQEELLRFEARSQGGEAAGRPEKPRFTKLAEEHRPLIAGVSVAPGGSHASGTPELISALEAERLEVGIGKSSVGQQTSFIEAVFEQLPKQWPETSQDTDGNHYLFWKVDEAEERVPELEDAGVRERVVRAWKTRAARILARQEAEQMAAKAREAGKPLAEVFPARASDVVASKPFSWLTYGAIQPWMAYAPPSLSAVEGVDTPGDDFMRAVFALKKGELGAAMNQPQAVAYVVRLTDSNPLPDVLWSQFTAESYLSYFRASWHDQSTAEEAWLDRIKKEVGFAWDPAWQREAARK